MRREGVHSVLSDQLAQRPGHRYCFHTTTILVGSLALDMYDVAKKQLVWGGIVTKTIDENARPETRRKNLTNAFEKLLKNYPPGKRS